MLRVAVFTLALAVAAGGVAKADCQHFKWSVSREVALFGDAPEPVEAGADVALGHAYAVTLKPSASAGFVEPPERAPKAGTFGGVLKLAPIDRAGPYETTLSGEAWVDVIQNGARVKSDNFSGQKDCPGVRKSVRFNLAAGPATVQISNADAAPINFAIVPAP